MSVRDHLLTARTHLLAADELELGTKPSGERASEAAKSRLQVDLAIHRMLALMEFALAAEEGKADESLLRSQFSSRAE
jgi:hypothetical protein